MEVSRKQIGVVLIGILAISLLGIALGLTNTVTTEGNIPLGHDGGIEVTFTGVPADTDTELFDNFPDGETVHWRSGVGEITVSSSDSESIEIAAGDIEGEWTVATSLNGIDVSLDPGDKQQFDVNGADEIEFRDVRIDDGNNDFIVTGSGTATVTIHGFEEDEAIVAKDGNTDDFLDGDVASADGTVTFDIGMTTPVYLVSNDDNTPDLSNPTPEGVQSNYPTEISIDVSDDDFPNDEVDVDFTVNGNDEGTVTLHDDGAASVSIDSPELGENTVEVTATDMTGNSVTRSWTFSTPEELTIREVHDPDTVIDDREVSATFFDGENIIERSTTDGTMNMDGLTVSNQIVVSMQADSGTDPENYHDVDDLIIDFTEQQSVYLLSEDEPSRTVRFTLEDRTGGQFENNDGAVTVQKSINRTDMDRPEWITVFGDEFGPAGATATLEDGQRYRIKIRNSLNDERNLGTYTADADETVPLSVGQIGVVPEGDGQEWEWNATWDDTGDDTQIKFQYNDSMEQTDTIWIEIYEFNNESNVLVENQSFAGPYGTFSFTEIVPEHKENVTYAVSVTVIRGTESHKITTPVGDNVPILPALPVGVKLIISIGTIILTAGLFSQLNGHIGALVVAGMGGLFWWINFLPEGTELGIVVLAMVTAGLIFIRERAGGSGI